MRCAFEASNLPWKAVYMPDLSYAQTQQQLSLIVFVSLHRWLTQVRVHGAPVPGQEQDFGAGVAVLSRLLLLGI